MKILWLLAVILILGFTRTGGQSTEPKVPGDRSNYTGQPGPAYGVIRINGYVYKNYVKTSFQKECGERMSNRCILFHYSLCQTIRASLHGSPKVAHLVGPCGVEYPDGDTVKSFIQVPDGVSSVNVKAFEEALLEGYRYAKRDNTYYGDIISITVEGLSTEPDVPDETTERFSSTDREHVSTDRSNYTGQPGPAYGVIRMNGLVYKNYVRTSFQEECGEPTSYRCQLFHESLCQTIRSSLKGSPKVAHLDGPCGVEYPDGDTVKTFVEIPEGVKNVSITDLIEALHNGYKYAKENMSYYAEVGSVTVEDLSTEPDVPDETTERFSSTDREHVSSDRSNYTEQSGPAQRVIHISGYVYKNYVKTTYQKECGERMSNRCILFHYSLCQTTRSSLKGSPKVAHLVGSCGVDYPDGDQVKTFIQVPDGVSSVNVRAVEEALLEGYRYAKRDNTYYGDVVSITVDGLSTEPDVPDFTRTSHPSS